MTTWLIRLHPDTRDNTVRDDLRDANRMHRRMMSLLPDVLGERPRHDAGLLYRLDHSPLGPSILAQTTLKPELDRLPPTYGEAQIRELDPLLDRLRPGQQVAYRLAANTTKRAATGPHTGRIVPLTGDQIETWWTGRAPHAGLAPRTILTHQQDAAIGTKNAATSQMRIHHTITRFDGAATITDPDLLRAAILTGIGRGKSYGCGLLSIAIIGTTT